MKICYVERKFAQATLDAIQQANAIIDEYETLGFLLTLRQLYYQFVSRDLIANKTSEYKRLGQIINDGRLAGLIDWERIEDRTRSLKHLAHWESPASIIDVCARQFMLDHWAGQKYRVEVWIEKEALAGVFEGVCNELDVPFFCCRGYTSQSEMWVAAQRMIEARQHHQQVYILHFGDHDPSGIDMTRDITDRLKLFGCRLVVDRLALNMPQIEQYSPPPNPAKETDSRFAGYIQEFGSESWELDALEPQVLADLVRDRVEELRDSKKWTATMKREAEFKRLLQSAADRWDDVSDFLGE